MKGGDHDFSRYRALVLLAIVAGLFIVTASQEPKHMGGDMSLTPPERLKWVQIRPGRRDESRHLHLRAKEMPHFALAKGETILQAHGVGPFKIIYANPADDPKNQQPKD